MSSHSADSIGKIGVLGSGQMGGGIAQTAAQAGIEVLLADVSLEHAEKGKAKIAAQLKKLVEKGKLTEADVQKTLNGIRPVRGLEDFRGLPFAIEAVTENPALKFD